MGIGFLLVFSQLALYFSFLFPQRNGSHETYLRSIQDISILNGIPNTFILKIKTNKSHIFKRINFSNSRFAVFRLMFSWNLFSIIRLSWIVYLCRHSIFLFFSCGASHSVMEMDCAHVIEK